jgi:hypothetical protein
MPQFYTNSVKNACVTLQNPKGVPLNYHAEFYMGTNLALVASKDFSIAANQYLDVVFQVNMPALQGTYPVYIGVYSSGKQIAMYRASEDVVLIPEPFNLIYTNPWKGNSFWMSGRSNETSLMDLILGSYITYAGRNSTRDDNFIPYDGSYVIYNNLPINEPLLLIIVEIDSNLNDHEFWYIFNIPRLGTYTLNARNQQISSAQSGTLAAQEMTKVSNKCSFTGTVARTSGPTINGENPDVYPSDYYYSITLTVESASDIQDYVNFGKYFIGKTITIHGSFPVDRVDYYTGPPSYTYLYSAYYPQIKTGDRISGELSVSRIDKTSPYVIDFPYWYATSVIKGG